MSQKIVDNCNRRLLITQLQQSAIVSSIVVQDRQPIIGWSSAESADVRQTFELVSSQVAAL